MVTVGPPAANDKFDKAAHVGHLLCFVGPAYEKAESGQFNSDHGARCLGVVCVECQQVWPNLLVFGSVLVPRLLRAQAPVVVARLVLGRARAGMNPPYLLADPSAADLAQGERIVADVVSEGRDGELVVNPDGLTAGEPLEYEDPF